MGVREIEGGSKVLVLAGGSLVVVSLVVIGAGSVVGRMVVLFVVGIVVLG